MALAGDAGDRADLVGLVDGMSPHEQLRLYVEIAQAAIVAGKIGSTRWAAEKATALAAKNSIEAHRAVLYDGAASVLTTDYDRGLAELEGIEAKRLPRSDAVMAEAAIALARAIRAWPQNEKPANAQPQMAGQVSPLPKPPASAREALPAALTETMNADDTTIAQAQQMMAQSAALLDDTQ
jgi:chemotaxis protein MotC